MIRRKMDWRHSLKFFLITPCVAGNGLYHFVGDHGCEYLPGDFQDDSSP